MELHAYTRYVHSSTHARTPISTYAHHVRAHVRAPAFMSVTRPAAPAAAGPARTSGTRPRGGGRSAPGTPPPPRGPRPGPRGRPRRNGSRVARARVGPARPTGSGPHVPAGHGGVPRVPGDASAERRAGAVRRTAPRVDAPCRYVSKGLLFVSGFRGRRSKSRRPLGRPVRPGRSGPGRDEKSACPGRGPGPVGPAAAASHWQGRRPLPAASHLRGRPSPAGSRPGPGRQDRPRTALIRVAVLGKQQPWLRQVNVY